MRKKLISLFMALVLVTAAAGSAHAVEAAPNRASDYLVGYGISLRALGDGEMEIFFTITGKGMMDKIGAQALYIEYEENGDWFPYDTLFGAQNPDFYGYNTVGYASGAYFQGEPGVTYRVELLAYAGRDGGSDTGTVTSPEAECK